MEIKKVKKRDGSIVNFNQDKIKQAIVKAAQASGSEAVNQASQLAEKVTRDLEEMYGDVELGKEEYPEVEDIQDAVEKVLIEEGHYSTAKAYILYRRYRPTEERYYGLQSTT